MGHRVYEPRRRIEALLEVLEGVVVRAALFEGLSQREIAAELETSKSRVNRLAHDTDGPSPLRDRVGYELAASMLSPTPIVDVAAARCWLAELRASDPVPLSELRAAVEHDLEAGASVRSVAMALPAPGTDEAELLLSMLWDWSRRAFVDVARGVDELRVGVYVPQGVEEASSLLPRIPASTVATLLGVPRVAGEWLDNGLRPVGGAAVRPPTG